MADAEDSTIILTFKYRLLPTKRQHEALAKILESQRALYNGALEHRIMAYQKAGHTITLYQQMAELTDLRKDMEFGYLPLNIQRWTLRRLDNAYNGFLRRIKAKNVKAGFPRFRGIGRWQSFGFSEPDGLRLNGKHIRFRGLPGGMRMHLHRSLPDGKPLSCTFTRDHKGWYVCLQYRVPCAALPGTGKHVGIDLGLKSLSTLSTGEIIPNLRITQRTERELRRRQRALARCRKGSNRRKKVKTRVALLHAKVANSRRTYLHQVSARLVREHDLIAVEKLNVKGLAAGMLAKSVRDVGWSILKQQIAYKAAYAGRQMIEVRAAGTSQTCPDCGTVKAKLLAERVHRCACGCVMDRDHAAAVVVLQRARSGAWASKLKAVA